MASIPTYLLCPNFTSVIEPERPTSWLGNIISDPLNPRRVLSEATIPEASVITVPEEENAYARLKSTSVSARLWAKFAQVASADTGVSASRSRSVNYEMTSMETMYLRDDPTDDDVTARIHASRRIHSAINSGLFGRKPVYMVTGLKIAHGLKVETSVGGGISANVSGEATVTPDGSVSAGALLEGSHEQEKRSSFKALENIIFAYQLHVITTKGWRDQSYEVDVYRSKAAFLSEHADAEVLAVMEANLAGKVHFEDILADSIEEGEVEVEVSAGEVDGDSTEQFCCVYAK